MKGHLTKVLILAAGLLSSLVIQTQATSAASTTANVSIVSGALTLDSLPRLVDFGSTPVPVTGIDLTQSGVFVITDSTGSGAGWNLTITSTPFANQTNSGHDLSPNATTIESANYACNNPNCTVPVSSINYTVALPAANPAPTAVKIFQANTDSGLGSIASTGNFSLHIPANVYSGSYTSTWTVSLTSGP